MARQWLQKRSDSSNLFEIFAGYWNWQEYFSCQRFGGSPDLFVHSDLLYLTMSRCFYQSLPFTRSRRACFGIPTPFLERTAHERTTFNFVFATREKNKRNITDMNYFSMFLGVAILFDLVRWSVFSPFSMTSRGIQRHLSAEVTSKRSIQLRG